MDEDLNINFLIAKAVGNHGLEMEQQQAKSLTLDLSRLAHSFPLGRRPVKLGARDRVGTSADSWVKEQEQRKACTHVPMPASHSMGQDLPLLFLWE